MSVDGEFLLVGEGESAKKVFRVSGTDFVVDEDSISSDWTSHSENDETITNATCDQRLHGEHVRQTVRKRICKWRVRQQLRKHRHPRCKKNNAPSSSSTSFSSASCTNDSIGDSDERRKKRNARRMSSVATRMEVLKRARTTAEGDGGISLEWISADKKHRDIAFAWRFLSGDEIASLHSAADHPTVNEAHDRKAYLPFKHKVSRFEMQLRALEPTLFSKLMSLMRLADLQCWRRLRKRRNVVYPEIEYIEYDVKGEGGDCYIEPHVDNKSAVTLIAMLSHSSEYVGGINCFRRASGSSGHRQMSLDIGDVVMFRGEKLLHWITNVTSGRRVVLQIELSRT